MELKAVVSIIVEVVEIFRSQDVIEGQVRASCEFWTSDR